MGFISLYNETSTLMTQMVKNLPEMRRPGFDPWVGRIPWRREWLPTPLLLLGEFHGQRSLTGYSPWSCKESDIIIIFFIIIKLVSGNCHLCLLFLLQICPLSFGLI